MDRPKPNTQYMLLGAKDEPSIANGNTWAESEITEECDQCGGEGEMVVDEIQPGTGRYAATRVVPCTECA